MKSLQRLTVNPIGQAATEYLLIVTAVLLAFSGIVALFSAQVNDYLSMLFKILTLPF
jgi:hypothetical protein